MKNCKMCKHNKKLNCKKCEKCDDHGSSFEQKPLTKNQIAQKNKLQNNRF